MNTGIRTYEKTDGSQHFSSTFPLHKYALTHEAASNLGIILCDVVHVHSKQNIYVMVRISTVTSRIL
jgi:hypothetical protein